MGGRRRFQKLWISLWIKIMSGNKCEKAEKIKFFRYPPPSGAYTCGRTWSTSLWRLWRYLTCWARLPFPVFLFPLWSIVSLFCQKECVPFPCPWGAHLLPYASIHSSSTSAGCGGGYRTREILPWHHVRWGSELFWKVPWPRLLPFLPAYIFGRIPWFCAQCWNFLKNQPCC